MPMMITITSDSIDSSETAQSGREGSVFSILLNKLILILPDFNNNLCRIGCPELCSWPENFMIAQIASRENHRVSVCAGFNLRS